MEVGKAGRVVQERDLHFTLQENVVGRQTAVGEVLGVQVREGVNNLPEDGQLAVVAQPETLCDQVGVERGSLDGVGDDGEPGGFTAGAHVKDKVLVSDLRQRPHVLQPGGDLLVILRPPAVDDDISVPTTVVDHAAPARAAVDFATELQLRVLYSEVPESQVHHLVCDEGVGEDAVLPPRVINDLTVV